MSVLYCILGWDHDIWLIETPYSIIRHGDVYGKRYSNPQRKSEESSAQEAWFHNDKNRRCLVVGACIDEMQAGDKIDRQDDGYNFVTLSYQLCDPVRCCSWWEQWTMEKKKYWLLVEIEVA